MECHPFANPVSSLRVGSGAWPEPWGLGPGALLFSLTIDVGTQDGRFATLEDVPDFYDDVDSRRGNDRNPNVSRDELDPLLRQLGGVDDDDDDDLLSFLRALSDASF